MIMLPIISSILFWAGGRDQWDVPWNQKLFRWLMGIPIACISAIMLHSVSPFWCILTYFIATNASSWGEKHPFRRWFGKYGQWAIYGFLLGLASLPVLGIWSILQGVITGTACLILMTWSNDGFNGHKLSHKYVELSMGLISTLGYLLI